ncbi:MAG TPA: YggT family protein [Oligoflexia bacterium]|nr:YggT family protein [Oligoflexia bacterium]
MIAIANLLIAVAGVLSMVIKLFYFLVIAAVILSWVSPDPRNPIVQFIYGATDPAFARIRNYVKPIGVLDLSPIVVLLALYFIDAFIATSLGEYGMQLKGTALGF